MLRRTLKAAASASFLISLLFGASVVTAAQSGDSVDTLSKTLPAIILLLIDGESGDLTPGVIIRDAIVGRDLQASQTVRLTTAPQEAVNVTLTVASGGVVALSTNPSAAGSNSVTFSGVTSTTVGEVYVQGRATGITTVSAQATGYEERVANVAVVSSGFFFETPSFDIAASASQSVLRVRAAALRSDTQEFVAVQGVRGGLTLDVPTASSRAPAGLLTNPIQFASNQDQADGQFVPLTAGPTTLSLTQPNGFVTPANRNAAITATVTSAATSNRARVLFDCDLQGVIGVMIMEVEIVAESGITWGSGPDPEITGVIGTNTYSTEQAGRLVSPVAHYVFTGRNDFAEFTEINTFERFNVRWVLQSNGLTMIINPFGNPTQHFCLITGSALL